jgi:hypothetical protein
MPGYQHATPDPRVGCAVDHRSRSGDATEGHQHEGLALNFDTAHTQFHANPASIVKIDRASEKRADFFKLEDDR